MNNAHLDTVPKPLAVPSPETIRAEVAPFRGMSPEERLVWFVRLQRAMDSFVRLRSADDVRGPRDRDFWRHWRDPAHGRPG